MNKEAKKRHSDFMSEINLPKPKPTPFDNPKSLRERIAYPLARMAYQAGKSDGRQEGFDDGLRLSKMPGRQGIVMPAFSRRNAAWLSWKAKWAEKEPSQHDYWVFDEGLRAGVELVLYPESKNGETE